MQNEWFLDVLKDLKAFAEANELCAVADKLEDLGHIARAELMAGATPGSAGDDARPSGRLH